jgi:hypothetical protein
VLKALTASRLKPPYVGPWATFSILFKGEDAPLATLGIGIDGILHLADLN